MFFFHKTNIFLFYALIARVTTRVSGRASRHIMAKYLIKGEPSPAAQALRRYFPAFMLIVLAGVLVCAAAYNFHRLGTALTLGALCLALLAVCAGLLQAHPGQEDGEDKGAPALGQDGSASLLGLADDNFSLPSLCAMLHEGIALLRNGRIAYANPALAYLLGLQETELVDTRISSHIHADDLAMLRLDDNEAKEGSAGGGPSRGTIRLVTLLGDVRWVICSVHKSSWQGEEFTLLLFEDIGPLKHTQEALAEQEQQARIMLERTPVGIAMFDAMGVLKISNASWRNIWSSVASGTRRFNILQDPFMPGSEVEKAARQAFNKMEAGVSSYEYNSSWGETRWLNLLFHPMLTPLDQLVGVIMIQHDITDSIRSSRRENDLNEQLATMRQEVECARSELAGILDTFSEAVVAIDALGQISAWNLGAEKRFKLPRKKVLGRDFKLPALGLEQYLPLLKNPGGHAPGEGGSLSTCLDSLDTYGPRHELALSAALNLKTGSGVMLLVRDVSAEVFANCRQALLSGLAALDPAQEAEAQAAPPGGEASLAEVLEKLCSLLRQGHTGLELSCPSAEAGISIGAEASALAGALADLAALPLRALPDGENGCLRISQAGEEGRLILNIFCQNALPKELPLLELWKSAGLLNMEDCFNREEQRRECRAFPLPALRRLAAWGCTPGFYLSPQGGAGIICRLPLAGEAPKVG